MRRQEGLVDFFLEPVAGSFSRGLRVGSLSRGLGVGSHQSGCWEANLHRRGVGEGR